MLKTLKFRLLASCLTVVFFSLGLAAWLADGRLEKESLARLEAALSAQAVLIESRLPADGFGAAGPRALPPLAAELGRRLDERVTFIDMRGRVLADSGLPGGAPAGMDNHAARPEVAAALAGSQGRALRRSDTLEGEMFYFARPALEKGRQTGIIRLAVPLAGVERQLAAIRRSVAEAAAVSAVLAVLLGLWLIHFLSSPFGGIIRASKRFAAGDLEYRAEVPASGELRLLAETLNSMAEDLARKMGELSAGKREVEAVLENMSEALVLTDGRGVIKAMNPAAERLAGLKPGAAAGRRMLDVFGGTGFEEAALEALVSGRPASRDSAPAAGRPAELKVNAAPVLEGGKVKGCVLVAHDVSELKKVERLRKDFVANVSHELKTPLTAIKGSVETLLGGAVDDREHRGEFLESVLRQASRLEALVDDLLRLSSLESAAVRLELSGLPLRGLAEEVHRSLLPAFKGKRISFENRVSPSLQVRADRKGLEQALSNLLDNAFKFTPDGGSVTLSASEETGRVRVTVADTGPGIPADSLPRVFERFYRVDKARSRELGGTGLGLSIVKHAVELHGGSVGVESEEGRGSAFWFTLPA